MKKKLFILFALSGMVLIWMSFVTPRLPVKQEKPNVLFIVVDDLRPQLGCYGHQQMLSPNIDKLAAEGLMFRNAYCNVPVCGASRSSFLTGIRPLPNRFIIADTWAEKDAPGAISLPEWFKRNGYHTISNGKVFHHVEDMAAESWSEKPWRLGANGLSFLNYMTKENQDLVNKGNRARGYPYEMADVDDDAYFDGQIATKTIADLKRMKAMGKPFFLAAGFKKPHLPFCAPKRYWDLYPESTIHLPDNYWRPKNAPDAAIHKFGELRNYAGVPRTGPVPDEMALNLIRGYYACVSYVDAQIGRVLKELEELGLADNTVVILLGDHGWQLGEHSLWCKHANFKTSLNTPLIIRDPRYKGNKKTGALVEFVDIFPSLCELAGLEKPKQLEGKSFVPLMEDPDLPWKEAVYSRFIEGESIKTASYLYTEWIDKTGKSYARMLYDHRVDPDENNNISEDASLTGEAESLSRRLHMEMKKTKAFKWVDKKVLDTDSLQHSESDIGALIQQASKKAHPRLFMRNDDVAAVKNKIASDPLLQSSFAYLIKESDRFLTEAPVRRDQQQGRRLLGVSRKVLERVFYLSFTYRMTGDKRYADRAEKEMLTVAAFPDWNPDHFLDVAEMTAGLAIGYDWLYDVLSPESKRLIKSAIIEKGLKESIQKPGLWWVAAESNWNQVCNSSLTLGALVVMEDEPALAEKIISRAVRSVPNVMDAYEPDGAYPEGPMYWGYGTTFNTIMLAALEDVFGTDLGLLKRHPAFLKSADYYLHAIGPAHEFFNYSDCSLSAQLSPAMYWLAGRSHESQLFWMGDKLLEGGHNWDKDSMARHLPLLFIWSPARGNEELPEPTTMHWKGDGITPVSMHRSGWGSDATYVGFKGGSPSSGHAHMDVGSFVMDALGERWASDLGSESYARVEEKGLSLSSKSQDADRWRLFRWNNFSHNTLVIDDQKQQVSGNGNITDFSGKGKFPHTVMDIGSVYAGQIEKAYRGIGLWENRSVLVQDELEALGRPTKVRWGMMTFAEVKLEDAHTALLSIDGEQLRVHLLSPVSAHFEIFDTAAPQDAKIDCANPGTKMLVFRVTLPANSSEQFRVWLCPVTGNKDTTPPDQPLSTWKEIQ